MKLRESSLSHALLLGRLLCSVAGGMKVAGLWIEMTAGRVFHFGCRLQDQATHKLET